MEAQRGTWALTRSSRLAMPATPTDVVDTVGAGDSFMAALIAALSQSDLLGASKREALNRLDQDGLQAVLRYATRASAITHAHDLVPTRRMPGRWVPFGTRCVGLSSTFRGCIICLVSLVE